MVVTNISPKTRIKLRQRGVKAGRTIGRADRPAVLGDGIRLHVAEDSNYYYFRFVEGEDENGTRYSAPGVALATGAPIIPQIGYPVTVGYDGNTPIIKEPSPQRLVQLNINPKITNWLMPDNKFIDLDFAIMGYSTRVDTTTSQNMEVMVKPFYYLDDINTYQVVGDLKLDLTSYIPTADGEGNDRHLLAGIFVDKDNTFSVVTSTAKVIDEELTHETDVAELFTNAPIRSTGIRAYKLYTGQTMVADTDSFCDLRMWFRTPLRKNNYTATTNPTFDDDIDLGYETGSVWINITDELVFRCIDNTDSDARWEILSLIGEQTGFPDRIDSVIDDTSFDDSTRTFYLRKAPAASKFEWYRNGTIYSSNNDKSFQISDIEGEHYIYFNPDGDLTETANPGLQEQLTLFSTVPLVTMVYWDKDNQKRINLLEERHGQKMDGDTHARLHQSPGTVYQSGLALGNFNLGSGNLNTDYQFSCANGIIKDEDIENIIANNAPQPLSPTISIPVFYKDGAAGNWRREWTEDVWQATTTYSLGDRIVENNNWFEVTTAGTTGGVEPTWASYPTPGDNVAIDGTVIWTNVGTPQSSVKNYVGGSYLLAWNEFTGGAWQQTEVGNVKYVLSHIYATNDKLLPVIAVQGQAEYNSISDAREGAKTEINNLIISGLPFPEFIPIASIIHQTATGYTNGSKARIIAANGGNFVNWLGQELSPTTGPSSHVNLTDLQGGTAGEYYHLTEAEHDIATGQRFTNSMLLMGG